MRVRDTYFDQAHASSFQNPYANIDASEEKAQAQFPHSVASNTTCAQTRASSPSLKPHPVRLTYRRYNHKEIEARARGLQIELWRRRHELWGESASTNPIKVLNASKALDLLGYQVRYADSGLGQFRRGSEFIEVAGLIDSTSKKVEISTLPSFTEQAFTLAHELGHVMLGSIGSGVHRDRALNGTTVARDLDERAADKFAAYFLMPSKLVRKIFVENFLTDCFELTEETAFALSTASLDVVQKELQTHWDILLRLASAERYNGRNFSSLAARFNVSAGAMAIRLREIGLVGK
jgi:hypothetical protein